MTAQNLGLSSYIENWIKLHMIQIPAHIQIRYKALLIKKAIPERYHYYYIKWLRYYLDYDLKYKFNQ